MSYYIYSTLANDQRYIQYKKGMDPSAPGVREVEVLIYGKAGIANGDNPLRIITPQGVRTLISDEEFAAIQDSFVFQLHQKNGFIRVEDKKEKADKVAKDMNATDKSRQLTPENFDKDPGAPVPEGKGFVRKEGKR